MLCTLALPSYHLILVCGAFLIEYYGMGCFILIIKDSQTQIRHQNN